MSPSWSGSTRFRLRAGFVGLRWSDVAHTLCVEDREFLRREFVPVACETFTGTTPEFWNKWLSDDQLDDLHGLVLVLDNDGVPAAWVASNMRMLGGRRCFYANSAGVRPRYQGSGLSSAIWRELLTKAVLESAPRTLTAVMRTANPLVYSAWSTAAGGFANTYPSPDSADIPPEIRAVALDAARELGQLERFTPETSIIEDAYDETENGLWVERPTSDQRVVLDWMNSSLGPKDAVVLVVEFHPVSILWHEAVRTLRRRVGLSGQRSSRSAN
ncbi:GNAT family N-acetyltransferase [Actinomycetes bacterium M1A6_2h]